jgi:hypothetical protein
MVIVDGALVTSLTVTRWITHFANCDDVISSLVALLPAKRALQRVVPARVPPLDVGVRARRRLVYLHVCEHL